MKKIKISDMDEFSETKYRTMLMHNSANCRLVLFFLEKGQKVDPHTSSSEVIMHIIHGKGIISVGDETSEVAEGDVIFCKENEPHGIMAYTKMKMLAVITPSPV